VSEDRIKSEAKRPDRDERGHFLPGHSVKSPGRPRGFDFRKVITDEAERRGVDLKLVLWDVFEGAWKMARKGDVPAAKFITERLCDDATSDTASEFAATVRLALARAASLEGAD
jgi:hypothetical protein